jgi:ketosteroid isomerase-like protein
VDGAQVIAGLAAGFAAAWNQHDMAALGRQFHDDAIFVSMAGSYMRGRAEIERAGLWRIIAAHSTAVAAPSG